MKKITALLLTLCLIIVAGGCNSKQTDAEITTQEASTPTSTAIPEEELNTELPTEMLEDTPIPTEADSPAPTENAPVDVSTMESKAMYVTGTSVNVRKEASIESERITALAQNLQVDVFYNSNGWYYVQYAPDKFGYMKEEFLSDSPVTTPTPGPTATPASNSAPYTHKENTSRDINDNVFLDALEFTGYNLAKHRADGNMWVFILGKYKYGLGYLSGLGYDYGNSSGYETDADGLPDIARMKKQGGLVCASYVTYVYFNYLPNVAGIDTSFLTKPASSISAQSWRLAAEDWVEKGYSRKISFTASRNSDGTVKFSSDEEIPVGSIVIFKVYGNSDWADARHVAIYAGTAGGYHWLTHVGNERGPEMITMERMGFSSTPEVPLEIITPPV